MICQTEVLFLDDSVEMKPGGGGTSTSFVRGCLATGLEN